MIIGITGGSGCGKTTLLALIQAQGGLVLDCDAIYHRLLETDPSLLSAIAQRFPDAVSDGTLNRRQLGNLVFSDETALADLNRITHQAVKCEVLRLLGEDPGLAAIDAIALFEGGLAELCDVTVCITAPKEQRIARLMARDGISREYAQKRLDAQHSDDWFRERCQYTLENGADFDAFATKCLAFLKKIGIMKEKSQRRDSK